MFFVDARGGRDDHLLDGAGEGFTIVRSVIEAKFVLPGILTEGWLAGIFGDPGAYIHEFCPQFINSLGICQLAACLKLPGFFPVVAVG